ncbi:MAG: MarR family transcriptional regulator [Nanoarchaeota archaeon]
MENKNVGWLIIGISVLIIGIIFLFNTAMKDIVDSTCTVEHLDGFCPAYETITQQTYLSLAIVGVLVIIGFVLVFNKPKERVIIRKVKEKIITKKLDESHLDNQEKEILKILKENKAVFQADLIDKTGISKVGMSRILDRLENRGFIERKRRGMNNIVVLK